MGESESEPQPGMFLFLGATALFAAFYQHALRPYLRVSTIVACVLFGILLGLLSDVISAVDHVVVMRYIPTHVVYFVFIPVVVFQSSFTLNPTVFSDVFAQAVLLAAPGMILNMSLTACLCKSLFWEWDWITSFLYGAIVSATDPVATVGSLKRLGADKRVAGLIEAESFLSDALSLVFFAILFPSMILGQLEAPFATLVGYFFQLSLGGFGLGVVSGWALCFGLSRVHKECSIEVALTIACAYLTFYIAEELCDVSGVVAVLTAGIYFGFQRTSLSEDSQHMTHVFWQMLVFFGNAIIATLAGILLVRNPTPTGTIAIIDLIKAVCLFILVCINRGFVTAILWPVINLARKVSWQTTALIAYSGLRGALALSLAVMLVVDEDVGPVRSYQILYFTACTVTLSNVVNEIAQPHVVVVLGLDGRSHKKYFVARAYRRCHAVMEATLRRLQTHHLLFNANWSDVREHISRFGSDRTGVRKAKKAGQCPTSLDNELNERGNRHEATHDDDEDGASSHDELMAADGQRHRSSSTMFRAIFNQNQRNQAGLYDRRSLARHAYIRVMKHKFHELHEQGYLSPDTYARVDALLDNYLVDPTTDAATHDFFNVSRVEELWTPVPQHGGRRWQFFGRWVNRILLALIPGMNVGIRVRRLELLVSYRRALSSLIAVDKDGSPSMDARFVSHDAKVLRYLYDEVKEELDLVERLIKEESIGSEEVVTLCTKIAICVTLNRALSSVDECEAVGSLAAEDVAALRHALEDVGLGYIGKGAAVPVTSVSAKDKFTDLHVLESIPSAERQRLFEHSKVEVVRPGTELCFSEESEASLKILSYGVVELHVIGADYGAPPSVVGCCGEGFLLVRSFFDVPLHSRVHVFARTEVHIFVLPPMAVSHSMQENALWKAALWTVWGRQVALSHLIVANDAAAPGRDYLQELIHRGLTGSLIQPADVHSKPLLRCRDASYVLLTGQSTCGTFSTEVVGGEEGIKNEAVVLPMDEDVRCSWSLRTRILAVPHTLTHISASSKDDNGRIGSTTTSCMDAE